MWRTTTQCIFLQTSCDSIEEAYSVSTHSLQRPLRVQHNGMKEDLTQIRAKYLIIGGEVLFDRSFSSVSPVDDLRGDLSMPLRHHRFLHSVSMRHHHSCIRPLILPARCTSTAESWTVAKYGSVCLPVALFV